MMINWTRFSLRSRAAQLYIRCTTDETSWPHHTTHQIWSVWGECDCNLFISGDDSARCVLAVNLKFWWKHSARQVWIFFCWRSLKKLFMLLCTLLLCLCVANADRWFTYARLNENWMNEITFHSQTQRFKLQLNNEELTNYALLENGKTKAPFFQAVSIIISPTPDNSKVIFIIISVRSWWETFTIIETQDAF